MTTYTTQMDAARKGIVTPQIKTVAEKEHMPVEKMMELVAEGKVAICANKHHTCLNPEGVGSMLRTKINVNLGVSRDCKDYDVEMQKVMEAVNMGAHAIMDLSSHGNTIPFRRKLTSECPAMIGTVPVYDSVIHYQRDLDTLTAKDFIDVVRLHAQDGVDFVTLHCGITRKTIDQIRNHKRKMNIVSRVSSMLIPKDCIEVKNRCDKEMLLHAKSDIFGHIVLILLQNAIAALSVSSHETREISLSNFMTLTQIGICVKDNGGGIELSKLPHLFSKTVRSENGLGFGLQLAHFLVYKELGGEIQAYNSDKGAVFEVLMLKQHM